MTFVYCMIDCAEEDWWMLCGTPMPILMETYLNMIRNHVLRTVADAERASVVIWDFVRAVLPMIHMDARKAFRDQILGRTESASVSGSVEEATAGTLAVFEEGRAVSAADEGRAVSASDDDPNDPGKNPRKTDFLSLRSSGAETIEAS
jgi:hypothetical protein